MPASVDASLETEDSTIDLMEDTDAKAEFKEELDVKPKDEALEAKGEDVSLTEEAKVRRFSFSPSLPPRVRSRLKAFNPD